MNTDLMNRYLDLTKRKRQVDEELRDLKQELDDLQYQIENEFIEAGVSSMRIDGSTIYIQRQFYASAPSDAVKTLQECGLDNCVSVGSQRLSALVREYIKEAIEKNPTLDTEGAMETFYKDYPGLTGQLKVGERVSVRVKG